MPRANRFIRAVGLLTTLSLIGCGTPGEPNDSELELASSIRKLGAEVLELRSALDDAQSNIEAVNSEIGDLQIAAFGTCEDLRFAASMLNEAEDIVVPYAR